MSPVRIIIDRQPLSGNWNMAVDDALLNSSARRRQCTLRIYRWCEPTVSLGYFQKPDVSPLPSGLAELPQVRRLSGGGAILHHHEITYSCVVPKDHALARETVRLYEQMHSAIVEALRTFSIPSQVRGPGSADDRGFLCFGRADENDVVCDGNKVVGSAQRRRQGAVLQHGSILLRRSPWAAEFPGIYDLTGDLTGEPVDEFELQRELTDAMGRRLGQTRIHSTLAADERHDACRLLAAPRRRVDRRGAARAKS